jgi:hypothetical protein
MSPFQRCVRNIKFDQYRLVSPRLASALLPLEFWVMASSLKLAMRTHLSQVISHIDAGLGKG